MTETREELLKRLENQGTVITVQQKGKMVRRTIKPLAELRVAIEAFARERHVKTNEPFPMLALQSEKPGLNENLRLLSLAVNGTHSAYQGFQILQPNGLLLRYSTERLIENLRHVVPESVAAALYENPSIHSRYSELFTRKNAPGHKLYEHFYGAKKGVQNHRVQFTSLDEALDNLYPEMAQRYPGRRLSVRIKGLVEPELLPQLCLEAFARGAHISESKGGGVKVFDERDIPVIQTLRKETLPGQLGLDAAKDRFVHYLEHAGVKTKHIWRDKKSPFPISKWSGHTGENELAFITLAARAVDAEGNRMPASFREVFPGPVITVYHDRDGKEQTPQTFRIPSKYGDEEIDHERGIVDVRVKCKHPLIENIAIESKVYDRHNITYVKRTIDKYVDADQFTDGETIDHRLLFLHANHVDTEPTRAYAREQGLFVVDSKRVREWLQAATNLLLERDPQFFTEAPKPFFSPQGFIELHDLLCDRPHVVHTRAQRLLRAWSLAAYRANLAALADGTRRRGRHQPPQWQEEPLTAIRRLPEGFTLPRGVLAFDTEHVTYGKGGSRGHQVFAVTTLEGGVRPIVRTGFARTPLEERALLEDTNRRIAEAEIVVTYHGANADIDPLRDRSFAWRLPFIEPKVHLDVYRDWYKHKRGEDKRTLQAFEASVLGYHRVGDVSGSKMKELYRDWLNGKDVPKMRAVLDHNKDDVVSTAVGAVLAAAEGAFGPRYQRLFKEGQL